MIILILLLSKGINMIDNNNELVKLFRMARDRFENNSLSPMKLRLLGK